MKAPDKIYVPTTGNELHYHMTCPNNEFQESIEYIRTDALVKYLYEEKGYPITLNGELVHWDELTKHLAEYYNWRKNIFIEKAWDWIENNILSSNQQDKSRLYFEQFVNYMKGE